MNKPGSKEIKVKSMSVKKKKVAKKKIARKQCLTGNIAKDILPFAEKAASQGMSYYLAREYLLGEYDFENMANLTARKWGVVPSYRHPELSYYHCNGGIRSGGLILLERPLAISEEENKKYPDTEKILEGLYARMGVRDFINNPEINNDYSIFWKKEEKAKTIKLSIWGRIKSFYKKLKIKLFN